MNATLAQTQIQEVVRALVKELRDGYVFPETAEEMAADLERWLEQSESSAAGSVGDLAATLTTRLQAISKDKHLRVWHASTAPVSAAVGTGSREEYAQRVELLNGGFHKVERLAGGVGYMQVSNFHDPAVAGEQAVAAMNFLASTQALIVDLRKNGGGSPAMVALISSYLFDRPVHLNSLYFRPQDQLTQFWTLPHVPGKRFGADKPVYVLTSRNTFSAAEEFSYNLKNLKRATIVGETTGGGANPGGTRRLPGDFTVFIPSGRAISPITQTNWEGTGVAPDVEVAAEEAFTTAYAAALERVIATAGEQTGLPWRLLKEEAEAALASLVK